jgi:LysR family nitrogen assimilation transcriptional regulator
MFHHHARSFTSADTSTTRRARPAGTPDPNRPMELRHLDAMIAIAETGSFTAAADELHTVQSNVSEMVRQLEDELGVDLLVRGRRGATPTEFGLLVLERARRVRGELAAMALDLAMVRGLEAGHASLGTVGTISRWLVPAVVADMRARAPGVSLRIAEAASERLMADVAERELSLAIVTEPVSDRRLAAEPLLEEDLVAIVPAGLDLGAEAPVPLAVLAQHTLVLPPDGNPLRAEVEAAAAAAGVELRVPVEVDGVRLIGDMVAAGAGISIIPETATPPDAAALRAVAIAEIPRRRLALVTARDARLTLADTALRDAVLRVVREQFAPDA